MPQATLLAVEAGEITDIIRPRRHRVCIHANFTYFRKKKNNFCVLFADFLKLLSSLRSTIKSFFFSQLLCTYIVSTNIRTTQISSAPFSEK